MNNNGNIKKLGSLLFDEVKEEVCKTESSLDIEMNNACDNGKNKNTIEHYLERYTLPCNNNFSSDVLNYEKITYLTIKNKLLQINGSLKSLNIILKNNNTKANYSQLNPTIIDNFLDSDNNKNYFINFLLEFVIDLIWKIKEENLSRDAMMDKLNQMKVDKDEMEKKNKKLTFDLEEKKKELKKIFNQNEFQKKKLDLNKKNKNTELNDLKNENKKLSNLISLLKNENKKKEMEYTRIQEKIKKVLSTNTHYKNNISCFEIHSNLRENSETVSDFEMVSNFFRNNNIYYSQEKLNLLADQNTFLFNILNQMQSFIEKISHKFNSLFSFYTNADESNKCFVDILQIRDNIFSLHLLDKNSQEEFENKFMSNIWKLDEIMRKILEMSSSALSNNQNPKTRSSNLTPSLAINNNKSSIEMTSPQKDIIKNFKKWSLNTQANSSNIERQSKWFENIEKPKEINYVYDENTVIKGDSQIVDEEMNTIK